MHQHFKLKHNKVFNMLGRGNLHKYNAAEVRKSSCLKAGFLRGTVKLLTDPAKPRVTRTHSPRAALGEALVALWGLIWQVGRFEGGENQEMGLDQCTSTQFMSVWRWKFKYGNRGVFRLWAVLQHNQQETHPKKRFVPLWRSTGATGNIQRRKRG